MPPEPLPWDRRDFRKHERSDPARLGGAGGAFRWRDLPHPLHPPPPHPHPYYHHHTQRWFSDFRSRPLPPGHGKQGGWHMYPEEPGRGFPPFGSRFNDRNLDEENPRSFVSRGDGRYFRNSRENRGSFSQKEWKVNSWEPSASPSGPGKLDNEVHVQRSLGNMRTCNSNDNHHNVNNSYPDPNSENLCNQSQVKCQNDENGSDADKQTSSGQQVDIENSLGSIDWKPLKWNRSESLSSRGSGLSHSSSSKSMGADSNDMKTELQSKNVMPVQSHSGEAVACVKSVSAAPALCEETSSRKKPRLGWGEGLAKYEKKNVDGPEDGATKNGLVINVNNIEPAPHLSINLAENSPRVAGLLDRASPATPSSVACSSSLGIEEKQSVKTAGVDPDAANLSCSQTIGLHAPCGEPPFNLENLEPSSISNLSSYINELLRSDDSTSIDVGFVRSTAMKKLLVWKVDILKALEMTETEIDMLETEHKSLVPESRVDCSRPQPSVSPRTIEEVARPALMQFASCGVKTDEITPTVVDAELKDENVDSPGSVASKFVEGSSSGDDISPPITVKDIDCFLSLDVNNSRMLEDNDQNGEKNTGVILTHLEDFLRVANRSPTQTTDSSSLDNGEDVYNLILSSNKASAIRASEVLNKLLPANQYQFGPCHLQCDPVIIKKKFLMRRRFLQFKEKVIALKFMAFRHFWKDDRLLASIKVLAKSSKKVDRRFRSMRHSSQKHLSSEFHQFSYPDGVLNVVPEAEVSDYVSRMLSDSQVKLCRDTLQMPALILDGKEKVISKFISSNGLVEDPCAVEKERSIINPWTSEEMEIFIDKLAAFGKDFQKIASFLDHKTTADCIEFYYKNHKSDCFLKARKRPDFAKSKKSRSTSTYLVASGKRWNREVNAASLDMLGAASASAAVIDGTEIQQNLTSRYFFGTTSAYKAPRVNGGPLEQSNIDVYNNDREAVAADVLAGICGSLSSEAMSSCITSSVDLGEGYQDWRHHRVGSSTRQPLTPEVTQNVDGECSDESCGEMDPTDWTDEEKSIFIQAVSSYGKDFAMISRCVRTRTRDQCKVYFSKARKCLGLDLIHPPPGDVVSGGVNGGGSDTEGACVVETGSVICSEKSRCTVKENLPSADVNRDTDIGTVNLNPNEDKYENNNGTASQHSSGIEPMSNTVPIHCEVDDKRGPDYNGSGKEQNYVNCDGSAAGVDKQNPTRPSIEEADDRTLPSGPCCEAENAVLLEASNAHHRKGKIGREHLLPEGNLTDKKVEIGHVISGEVRGISSMREMKCESQPQVNPCCPPADVHSSSQDNISSGCQKKAALGSSSASESVPIMLQRRDCSATVLLPQCSGLNKVSSLAGGDNGIKYEQSQGIVLSDDCHLHPVRLSTDHESAQILSGYPLSVSTVKEMNGDMNFKRPILSNGNFNSGRQTKFHIQKCSSLRNGNSVAEASRQSGEPVKDHHRPESCSSRDLENPCGNGDVKLFGKILISSEQKPISSKLKSENNRTEHHKAASQITTFEHNSLGSEKIPVKNFGFCDGNKMQIGFPNLPDSTLLLSKYADAFSNCVIPSAKLAVRTNCHNLDGISVFPTQPISSNGATDYPVLKNQEVQPFSIDMKRQQDLYAGMQRRNGFDVSGVQQQARGTVGINVVGRGGVLVGGQSTGVSDPVAVIKMHYAKAEQFSAQNIIVEDDTWRSKGGDVGR